MSFQGNRSRRVLCWRSALPISLAKSRGRACRTSASIDALGHPAEGRSSSTCAGRFSRRRKAVLGPASGSNPTRVRELSKSSVTVGPSCETARWYHARADGRLSALSSRVKDSFKRMITDIGRLRRVYRKITGNKDCTEIRNWKMFLCHIPKPGRTYLKRALEAWFRPEETVPDETGLKQNAGRYPPSRSLICRCATMSSSR